MRCDVCPVGAAEHHAEWPWLLQLEGNECDFLVARGDRDIARDGSAQARENPRKAPGASSRFSNREISNPAVEVVEMIGDVDGHAEQVRNRDQLQLHLR